MKKTLVAVLAFAAFFISNAGAEDYKSRWVAPAQTYWMGTAEQIRVGTTPWNSSFDGSTVFSTASIFGPVIIASSNSERIAIDIVNESTVSFANLDQLTAIQSGVKIYIGTSPQTTGWDTTVTNQKPADLAFSSNSSPAPFPGSFVLMFGSTTPFVSIRSQASEVIPSSNTVVNPLFNGLQNSSYVNKNIYREPGPEMLTYVGPWYAVTPSTGGVKCLPNPGIITVRQREVKLGQR